jgi:3-isopropylmalate/(R)-2-methylmalate dehydratase large subunit
VLVTGETWVKVPETYLIRWSGALRPGVAAKDMMLALCGSLGLNTLRYNVAQYAGDAVSALSMTERMVLCNMATELGAMTGIVVPDATTVAAMRAAGMNADDALEWGGDDGARYEKTFDHDASSLAPQVAAPHSPDNVAPIGDFADVEVGQAYIGACTGAKLSDLHMAAAVLKGRKVAPGVRLLVAPASTRITAAAAADGTLAVLTEAGAILLPSGCGACAGLGAGLLAENEVCISSTARNFKGRMGATSAEIYLASPYSVAATAIVGRIADPRALLAERAAA